MQLKHSLTLIAICLAASCSLAPVRAVTLQSRQAPGSLGLGEKCSQSVQCQTGNCRRAHCAEKVGNGNTCYKDANCISNDCYDASICYTPGGGVIGNGARCSTSASCASGNCSRSRCADKVYLGGPCYKDNNCASGSCSDGICVQPSPSSTSSTASSSATSTTTSASVTKSTSTTTSSTKTTSTTTSTTKTTSTTTTTTSTSASSTATVKCTLTQASLNIANVANPAATSVNPYGFETIKQDSNSANLQAVNRAASLITVEAFQCDSAYMGYTSVPQTVNSPVSTFYGQIRIASSNNCITATNPGGINSKFTSAPCATKDDSSQIAQFFEFINQDSNPIICYVGQKFAGNPNGLSYSQDSGTKSQGAQLSASPNDSDNCQTFFLYPAATSSQIN